MTESYESLAGVVLGWLVTQAITMAYQLRRG